MRRILYVLVGVRGSGKSTLCTELRSKGWTVLTPSTTRPPRGVGDSEYHFVKREEWEAVNLAWVITVGQHLYGMRNAEIETAISKGRAVTVFDPASIERLQEYRARVDFEVITVGLDTVTGRVQQRARVGNDQSRVAASEEAFNEERERVLRCDAVLTGDVQVLCSAMVAISRALDGGGLLDDATIRACLAAGLLLRGAEVSSIQPASYDLRLGAQAWDGGLKAVGDGLRIPAYGYVVAVAAEEANLPNFVAGRFDLRVSMFVSGIILSNGPQVDPGYQGALFCLLYNASDEDFVLHAGRHFATLEFRTTVRATSGYRDHYQRKREFADFMDGKVSAGRGALLAKRIGDIEREMSSYKQWIVGTGIAVILAIAALPVLVNSCSPATVPSATVAIPTTPSPSVTSGASTTSSPLAPFAPPDAVGPSPGSASSNEARGSSAGGAAPATPPSKE